MPGKQQDYEKTAKVDPVDAEHSKDGAPIMKARYWWAVLYPENMRDDWEDVIGDLLQVPFAYCIHSKDTDTKSEHRKDHVHLIIAFRNTTTYSHALGVFRLLGAKALNTCQAVVNIRHAYDYLIHSTETCRKQGKHEYSADERVTGNNFDIGEYEQLGTAEKQEMLMELVGYIIDRQFTTIVDFTVAALQDFGRQYWEIIVGYNGTLERYCRGNYLKWKQAETEAEKRRNTGFQHHEQHENLHDLHDDLHEIACPNCGSVELQKRGKTASGLQRYLCRECGKSFSQ